MKSIRLLNLILVLQYSGRTIIAGLHLAASFIILIQVAKFSWVFEEVANCATATRIISMFPGDLIFELNYFRY